MELPKGKEKTSMENKIYNHPYFGEIYYLLDIPEKIKDNEKKPLLIFLHGAGERGADFELLKVQGPPKYLSNGTWTNEKTVTVCPQCPKDITWVNLTYMLKDFLEFVIDEYGIDREKIALTGISMGGYGTWEMSMFAPEYFKKIAPICGGGTPWRAYLINAEIRAFHGDKDTTVPPENSQMMVNAAKANGKDVTYTVFPGVDHNSWDPAYLTTDVLEWLTDL